MDFIMGNLPEVIAKFAAEFHKRLAEEHQFENTMFSPVNAYSSLGVLALGSGPGQRDQIAKALNWELFDEDRYRRHMASYTDIGDSEEKDALDHILRPIPEPIGPTLRPHPEPVHPGDSRWTIHQTSPEPEPKSCPASHVPDYECEKPEGVHTEFNKILAALNKPSNNYTLSFANKIYGDFGVAFIQKFIFCALKLCYTDVEEVDLRNAPEEVRRYINLWVEIHTHCKIKDLFPKGSFDHFAQLLQTNALYFKGQWEVKFDKALTAEAPFYAHHTNAKDNQTVQLMHRKGVYNTATFDMGDVEVQVLEIPYKDKELSFYALLPTDHSPEALQQLEEGLINETLLNWSHKLKPEEVDVAIPKFSMEKSLYLHEYLNQLHLTDPEKAGFSGATTTEGVALTQFVHHTLLEIDEEGGEEPEAPRPRRNRRPPVDVLANRPFLFFIEDNSTEAILLFGKFAKPE